MRSIPFNSRFKIQEEKNLLSHCEPTLCEAITGVEVMCYNAQIPGNITNLFI